MKFFAEFDQTSLTQKLEYIKSKYQILKNAEQLSPQNLGEMYYKIKDLLNSITSSINHSFPNLDQPQPLSAWKPVILMLEKCENIMVSTNEFLTSSDLEKTINKLALTTTNPISSENTSIIKATDKKWNLKKKVYLNDLNQLRLYSAMLLAIQGMNQLNLDANDVLTENLILSDFLKNNQFKAVRSEKTWVLQSNVELYKKFSVLGELTLRIATLAQTNFQFYNYEHSFLEKINEYEAIKAEGINNLIIENNAIRNVGNAFTILQKQIDNLLEQQIKYLEEKKDNPIELFNHFTEFFSATKWQSIQTCLAYVHKALKSFYTNKRANHLLSIVFDQQQDIDEILELMVITEDLKKSVVTFSRINLTVEDHEQLTDIFTSELQTQQSKLTAITQETMKKIKKEPERFSDQKNFCDSLLKVTQDLINYALNIDTIARLQR